MLKKLKRGLLFLISVVAICVAIAVVWSFIPVQSGKGDPDPTVVFENQRAIDGQVFTESYFRHNGVDLHVVETGKQGAETILFMHGFPSYWYSFIRLIEDLRSDYRIIAIDGLGAGRSDAPSDLSNYQLDSMAEHVAALLADRNVSRVHLVGHDWGSAFVFGFAQKYPELANTVTGISAPPFNVLLKLLLSNSAQQEASSYVEKLKGANAVLLKAFSASNRIWEGAYAPLVESGKLSAKEGQQFRNATSNAKRINRHINWYRANIPRVEDIQEDDFWPSKDSRIEVPALIVWGNDDRVFEDEFIQLSNELSADLTVLRLDGVGHWPHVQESQQVAQAIRALFAKRGELNLNQ